LQHKGNIFTNVPQMFCVLRPPRDAVANRAGLQPMYCFNYAWFLFSAKSPSSLGRSP